MEKNQGTYNDDPADWTPGAGEEEDIEADECDEDHVGGFGTRGHADDGDDEFAKAHSDGAEEEKWAATPFLNEHETGEGGDYVDEIGGQADEEGVVDSAALKELSSIVENKVDASKLRKSLNGASGEETLSLGAGFGEAIEP